LHISLSPNLAKLIELVDLRVLDFNGTILAGPSFIYFTAAAAATSSRAHPAVELSHQHAKLLVAKLTILLVLRWPELTSLRLNQRVESIDLLAGLKLLFLLLENSCYTSRHLHELVSSF